MTSELEALVALDMSTTAADDLGTGEYRETAFLLRTGVNFAFGYFVVVFQRGIWSLATVKAQDDLCFSNGDPPTEDRIR